jgi:hypothetical protein
MKLLNDYIIEYKKQMEKGDIKVAYRGLMKYMMDLRSNFKNKYPDYFVSSSIYHGLMDMTFFTVIPESLKTKKLKVVIVLVHDSIRFEAWLSGFNKQIQSKYWKSFKESGWDKYHVPNTIKGIDSILEYTLVDKPDFNDLNTLTNQIEERALDFIKSITSYLSKS